jgi:hypothetical protein
MHAKQRAAGAVNDAYLRLLSDRADDSRMEGKPILRNPSVHSVTHSRPTYRHYVRILHTQLL